MDEMSFSIEVPSDDEGYISMQCPACRDRFKLSGGEINEREPEDLHCPLCGLSAGLSDFYDPAVIAVAMEEAQNYVADLINEWGRGMERASRGNKTITFQKGRDIPQEEVSRLRETPDLVVTEFDCCSSTAKVGPAFAVSLVYCAFCGRVRP